MRTYTNLAFWVKPEEHKAITEEAQRLNITKVELLRRMFKTWQTVSAEEEKRKKNAMEK